MASGYMPVDTPPGTTPMPLGSPVPTKVGTAKAPPRKKQAAPPAKKLGKRGAFKRGKRSPMRSR